MNETATKLSQEEKPEDRSLFATIEMTTNGHIVAIYPCARNDKEEGVIWDALAPINPRRASPGFWSLLRRVA